MSRTTPSEAELVKSLSQIKLSTTTPLKTQAKPKSKPVADTWDETLSGSETETDTETLSRNSTKNSLSPISTSTSATLPNAPPPTPSSPPPFNFPDNVPYGAVQTQSTEGSARSSFGAAGLEKRPEKSTATVARFLANDLGIKIKRTEEQREKDRVQREMVRKKREDERREKAAAEERKRSVWED